MKCDTSASDLGKDNEKFKAKIKEAKTLLTSFQNNIRTKYSEPALLEINLHEGLLQTKFFDACVNLGKCLATMDLIKQNKCSPQDSALKTPPEKLLIPSSEIYMRDPSRSGYVLSHSKR